MSYLNVYFFTRLNKKKQGCIIYCRASLRGKRKDFSLGKIIPPNLWDKKKGFPNKKHPEGKRYYDHVKAVEKQLYDAELKCIKNNNTYSIQRDFQWLALGIDGDFDTWFMNLYIYQLSLMAIDDSPYITEASDADRVSKEQQFVFPSINIGQYLNKDKESLWGLALGFYSGSMGGIVYYSNKLTESISLGVSIEALLDASDISAMMSASNRNNQEENSYKNYLFSEPKYRIGLVYRL